MTVLLRRHFWRQNTIARKTVTWFLVIALVPMALLLLLTQQLSQGLVRQTTLDYLRAVAEQKSRRIETFAGDHRKDIDALARIPLMAEAFNRLSDGNGRADGDAALRPSLTAFAELANFQDLTLVSPDNQVIFSLKDPGRAGSVLGEAPSDLPQVMAVLARARDIDAAQMSSFVVVPQQIEPIAYVAAPVHRGDRILGVALAQIGIAELWAELTDHSGLGDTGDVLMAERDGDGMMVLTPHHGDPNKRPSRRVPLEELRNLARTDADMPGRALAEAVMGIDGAGDTVDRFGVETLSVWRHLSSIDCGLEIKINRTEALALVSKQRQMVVSVALLTAGGVIVLALFAARSATRPIRALTDAARRMGAGDLGRRVVIEGDDEMAELGHAFNRMTSDLRDVYGSVEEQVRQRTRELRESNAELARARDELRKYFQAVECSPVSVVITNPDGRIEYVNPHYAVTTGYSVDEVIGCQPSVVASGRTDPRIYENLWSTIKAGGEWRGEFLNRRKDGSLYWEAAWISPVREPGGAITHFVAIEDDISARKETEVQLRAAKEAAEEANRAKSEFLAVMSHEIRTPMNGILGMTQLMLDTPLSSTQRDYLDTIRQSGVALLTLLNDILDFSKLEAGRVELESVDFDLGDTIEQVTGLLSARAREKNLNVTCDIDPSLPRYLRGDQARLRQVLMNLVGNAVKFTESGGVRVEVSQNGAVQGDVWPLRFAVVDTGIGIAAEVRDRLFQSFTQADSSITRRYGGSGLGLAICRRLIELHQGRIGVDSVPGKGSAFWFTLSYHTGQAPNRMRGLGLPNTSALPRMRILLAEDNAVNRKVALALLEKWGHRVTAVDDGRQAVAAVQREPFDMVLMDVQMPEMDGLEATRCIRALTGPAGRLPIVALTANAMRGDEVKCLEAGMDDYVSKPIEQERLYEAMDRVCRRRALAAGL